MNHIMVDCYMEALKHIDEKAVSHEKEYRSVCNEVCDNFTEIFYHSKMWALTEYRGITTYKYPNDLWILQELLYEVQPDLFVELGCFNGGTTLYVADILELNKKGMVVGVDLNLQYEMPKHDRIEYIKGDSVSNEIFSAIQDIAKDKKTIMFDLDSYHSKDHVATELELYSPLVSVDSYVIVEDTIINHPVKILNGDGKYLSSGPFEAVMEFLQLHNNFKCDINRQRYYVTSNPCGYLRRVN